MFAPTGPALPPDIKLALQSASNLIAGWRTACRQLRNYAGELNCVRSRYGTGQPGVRQRLFPVGTGFEDEIDYLSPRLQKITDDVAPLVKENQCRTWALYDQLAKVARQHIGVWQVASVTYSVGSLIEEELCRPIRALCLNRTAPYSDAEFIRIAAKTEPYLDEFDAEVVREAKQVALARERDALLVDPPKEVASAPPAAEPQQKLKTSRRDKKTEARDKWIYQRCCAGIPHDKIVADLKKVAEKKKWRIISSKQRVQQIGNEYADDNGLERPAPRKNL